MYGARRIVGMQSPLKGIVVGIAQIAREQIERIRARVTIVRLVPSQPLERSRTDIFASCIVQQPAEPHKVGVRVHDTLHVPLYFIG